jgi:Tfp pilus assembly protein PilX
MVVVIIVLLITALMGAAALQFAIRSIGTSTTDRNRDLALGAADEGADLAQWRMNRLLVPDPASLLGINPNLGCVNVGAGGQISVSAATVSTSGGLMLGICTGTSWENAGNNAWFSYTTQTDINLNNQEGLGTSIIERRVQVIGCAPASSASACSSGAGVQFRRLLLTFRLNTSLNPEVFERYRYVECEPAGTAQFSSTGVATGCDDPGD